MSSASCIPVTQCCLRPVSTWTISFCLRATSNFRLKQWFWTPMNRYTVGNSVLSSLRAASECFVLGRCKLFAHKWICNWSPGAQTVSLALFFSVVLKKRVVTAFMLEKLERSFGVPGRSSVPLKMLLVMERGSRRAICQPLLDGRNYREHIKKCRFFKISGVPCSQQNDMCRTLDPSFSSSCPVRGMDHLRRHSR